LFSGHSQHADDSEREYRVLSVRLSPALHSQLNRIAKEDSETVASTIRAMLRFGIEHRQAAR
jgi:predicted DNA-binding protein